MPKFSLVTSGVVFVVGTGLLVVCTNIAVAQLKANTSAPNLVYVNRPAVMTQAEREAQKNILDAGEFHEKLQMFVEFQGLEQPEFSDVADVDLPESTKVVGVEVDGQCCAFVLSKMRDPSRHIVNLMMNHRPVSIAYCDMSDCVRVVTNESESPLPLHVGGLDVNNEMVLLYEGQRYAQRSDGLPLTDYPFSRMTLGDWIQQHPNTRVCIPPDVSDFE